LFPPIGESMLISHINNFESNFAERMLGCI
jgi:hypothetical protein